MHPNAACGSNHKEGQSPKPKAEKDRVTYQVLRVKQDRSRLSSINERKT
jgi:hypothetical protein